MPMTVRELEEAVTNLQSGREAISARVAVVEGQQLRSGTRRDIESIVRETLSSAGVSESIQRRIVSEVDSLISSRIQSRLSPDETRSAVREAVTAYYLDPTRSNAIPEAMMANNRMVEWIEGAISRQVQTVLNTTSARRDISSPIRDRLIERLASDEQFRVSMRTAILDLFGSSNGREMLQNLFTNALSHQMNHGGVVINPRT